MCVQGKYIGKLRRHARCAKELNVTDGIKGYVYIWVYRTVEAI